MLPHNENRTKQHSFNVSNPIKIRSPHSLPFLILLLFWSLRERSKDITSEYMSGNYMTEILLKVALNPNQTNKQNYFPSEPFGVLSKHYARKIAFATVRHR